MSIFSSLFVGASGMRVNESAIAVIGDNIANMNSIGFKGSRGVFSDVLSQTVLGAGGPAQVGQGSSMMTVDRLHAQGALLGTGVSTDIAIGGEGFFMVNGEAHGGEGTFFTRNGQFHIDSDGYVVNQSNLKLQGYMATSTGAMGTSLTDLQIEPRVSPPVPTEDITMHLNLNNKAEGITPVFGDPDNPPTADYSTSISVFDSQGTAHTVDFYFTKDPDPTVNTWTWVAVAEGGEIDGGTEGEQVEIGTGTLEFDTDGNLLVEDGVELTASFVGATADQVITVDFGDSLDTDGAAISNGTTQWDGKSTSLLVDQDGRGQGDFQFLQVLVDGTILATYSNGDERTIGQVALAEFRNARGLEAIGGSLYSDTSDSGEATVGEPNTGGRGELFSGALEGSSVDLTQEFTQMIVAQRGFQASSRTVTTADQLLTEVINLKR